MLTMFALANIVLLFIDVMLMYMHCAIDEKNLWNWGWIIISFQIIYIVLSFKTVGPEEKAAVLLFKRPMYEVKSGLIFVPWLVCSLRKESRLTIQMQIPGEPEEIDKSGDDNKGLLPGKMFLPIRSTTASYEIVKKNKAFANDPALVEGDPLNRRMTLEPTAQIRFKIKDLVKFIQTIGSIKEAKKQLRDTAEGVIDSEFGKRTPALIIAHRSDINKTLRKEIGKLVKDDTTTPEHNEWWGVDIETAQLLDLDISKKVNEALSQVAEADVIAKKTVIVAEASKKSAKLAGQGAASAELSMLTAQAAGQQLLANTAKTKAGKYALTLQTVNEMTAKSKFSIVGGDGLLGVVASAKETLDKIVSPKEESPKK